MDRRNFLAAGAAAAIGGITGNSAQAQCCTKTCGCNGPNMQIGLILYTIRDYLKTPQDIAKTLEKVSKIGYRNIELASVGA
ncbi:twin-arginine translocation signal domain-containing protein, partial [bacterium]|nr:twin-arginine translocation signal domain-containing protein [bacterium]